MQYGFHEDHKIQNTQSAGSYQGSTASQKSHSQITPEQRAHRFGHEPTTVWLTGPTSTGKRAIAYALEQRLFAAGYSCSVLDRLNAGPDSDSDIDRTIRPLRRSHSPPERGAPASSTDPTKPGAPAGNLRNPVKSIRSRPPSSRHIAGRSQLFERRGTRPADEWKKPSPRPNCTAVSELSGRVGEAISAPCRHPGNVFGRAAQPPNVLGRWDTAAPLSVIPGKSE